METTAEQTAHDNSIFEFVENSCFLHHLFNLLLIFCVIGMKYCEKLLSLHY